jgi:hypothetical protein
MRSSSSAFVTLFLSSLLAACSGGDGPTDPVGGNNNGGGTTGPVVKTDPSFAGDIWELLQRNSCASSGCHGSGQGGLTMTSAAGAYAALVNVASPATGEIRVIPNNANDSYMVKKLEGRQSVGDRMPLGGQIGATDLANVKNWINQGAKNN